MINKSYRWENHVKHWLGVTEVPVLIVGYENLVKDTYTELKRILHIHILKMMFCVQLKVLVSLFTEIARKV